MKHWLAAALVLAAMLAHAQQRATSAPAFQIGGTVVNAVTGAPLRGAKLTIANVNERSRTRDVMSTDTGQFIFDRVFPGKYSLVLRAKGFRAQAFEQHEGFSSAIAVGPGKWSTGIVFRAQPNATIVGHVTGQFSEPVQEGQVHLFRDAIDNGVRSIHRAGMASLNDEGEFRFKRLPAGKYYIAVAATPWYAQYANAALQFAAATQNPSATDATSATSDVSQDTLALLDTAYPLTFFGNVTDDSAALPIVLRPGEIATADIALTPVRAAHVSTRTETMRSQSGEMSRMFGVQQQVFGELELAVPLSMMGTGKAMQSQGFAPGHYKVTLETYGKNGVSTSIARDMDLSSDTTEITMDDTASSSAIVSGKLQDGGTTSQFGEGRVVLVDRGEGRGYSAKLLPNGEFTFAEQVPPGKYQVFMNSRNMIIMRDLTAKGAHVVGREVTIPDNAGSVVLNIVASRGVGTVTGTAFDSDRPRAGVMIVLVPDDPVKHGFAIRRDQSDSDGTFTLNQVVPGRYTVIALHNGWDMEWNNPEVLKGYLARGTRLFVAEKSRQDIRVEVQ